jgi:hypothetical protein
MSDTTTNTAQNAVNNTVNAVANGVEKAIAEQTARFEAAVADLGKLQAKGVAQAQAFFENATRLTQEHVAFAEQLGGEWRKIALAATRSAAELFAPKA